MKLHKTRGIAVWALALIWWGMLYPELCFPKDTYEIVSDGKEILAEDMDVEMLAERFADESCRGLLYADGEQVIVKSRFLEWLKQYIKE